MPRMGFGCAQKGGHITKYCNYRHKSGHCTRWGGMSVPCIAMAGYIQLGACTRPGTFWVPPGTEWGSCRSGNPTFPFKHVHIGFILDSYFIHIGFILDSYWIHIGSILDSYWIHTGFLKPNVHQVWGKNEHVLDSQCIHIGFILDSHWFLIGITLDLYWFHVGFILDSYWIHI